MLPFLLYIATLVYVPHFVFGLAIIYAFAKRRTLKSAEYNNYVFGFLILIVILSILNFVGHVLIGKKDADLIPYTVLMIGSYIIAINLGKQDLRILIYLIVAECFFGYIEFTFGVKTFFTGLDSTTEVRDRSLLYYRSVFGLSDNSSSFAVKVLLAYLLTYYIELGGKERKILRIILLIGLVLSFNRSSFVAILLFHGIQFLQLFIQSGRQVFSLKMNKFLFFSLVLALIAIVVGSYLVVLNFELIATQLTRRTGAVEITGRELTWKRYYNFISDNLIFGNGSHKYLIYYPGTDKSFHAHNSYLQVLATHGVIIFALHLLLVMVNINRKNFIFVITILVYSVTQYGIFWGISLTDVIFLVFLMTGKVPPKVDVESS